MQAFAPGEHDDFPMQLFATPLSHFSRKVRLLLDHYDIEYEFVDVGNVANAELSVFDGNPLMRVPVLKDGALWLIESDHIEFHLVCMWEHLQYYGVVGLNYPGLDAIASTVGARGRVARTAPHVLRPRT